jgi:hypothetical protein
MTSGPGSFASRFPVALFLLGLALRLPGLLFNGMGDLYQIILDWGAGVHHLGLVDAFGINYGILSYAAFGAAEAAAEWIPRFWWAPYKLLVIAFDTGVCLALLALVPPRDRRWLICLVWLNPWFIIHGAYHGFWEGPHLLFGLLAVLTLSRFADEQRAWAAAGALLMCSAMFKPQGLIHFAGPLGLYLAVQYVRGVRRPLVSFSMGLGAVAMVTFLGIWIAGGSKLALYDNYRSAATTMGKMSNGGPGLWRFLSWAYMEVTHQSGLVLDMKISRPALATLTAVSGLLCAGILLPFSIRLGLLRREPGAPAAVASRLLRPPDVRWPDAQVAFAVLTLGALVVSQFGPRAHINHSYVPMMMLALFALRDRVLFWLWVAMNLMLGLAHLSTFGFGGSVVTLPVSQWFRYPQAGALLDRIRGLAAYSAPDGLLALQATVNGILATLPGQRAISMMSVLVFLVACGLVWRVFRSLDLETRVFWQPPASDPPAAAMAVEGKGAQGTSARTTGS